MCLALQAQTHTHPAFTIRERTNQEASRPEVCMCVCAMIYTLYVFGGFILNDMNFITHFCKFVLVRIYLYKDMQGRRISVCTEYKKEKKKCFSSSTSPSCVDLLQFGICLMQTPSKAASSSPSPCPLSASSTLARTLTKQRTTSCSWDRLFDTLHFSSAVSSFQMRGDGSVFTEHIDRHLALIRGSKCFYKVYFWADIIHHLLFKFVYVNLSDEKITLIFVALGDL